MPYRSIKRTMGTNLMEPKIYRDDFPTLAEARKWARRKSLQVKDTEFICTYSKDGLYLACTHTHYRTLNVAYTIRYENKFFNGISDKEFKESKIEMVLQQIEEEKCEEEGVL